MRALLAVFRREFTLYFISPIAYIVLSVFLLAIGLIFFGDLLRFVEFARQAGAGMGGGPVDVMSQLITPYFFNLGFVGLFLLPLLTMRLMADERRQGTFELLLTYPITDLQMVMGKFLAALAFYGIMLLGTGWTVAVLIRHGNPDPGPIACGYLGMFLYGGALIALGLLVSALTENQIVAAALSFVLFLLLWLLQWTSTLTRGFLSSLLDYVSVVGHFQAMSQGILDTKDLVFFASMIFLGLYLTLVVVAARRWSGE